MKNDDNSIRAIKETLKNLETSWQEDGNVPSNYVRQTGDGNKIAEVNRWCGGFQDSHHPKVIGYQAWRGNGHCSESDVLFVSDFESVEACIEKAKAICDEHLNNH